MEKKYFGGKHIWVTGASSGIGAELAKRLSTFGVSLILTARNKDKLKLVKASCTNPNSVTILPCDLADEKAVSEILAKNESILSKVDILINNAGISQRSYVHETELEVYKRLMDINFIATAQLTTYMLKIFRKRKSGHFVTMSSVAGKFGVPERSGYSASKMALHGFFDALRAENKDYSIAVSIICPGFIQTDISKHALTGTGVQYAKLDDGQKNGMPVDLAVQKMVAGIARKKPEMYIGSMRETRLAIFVSRCFPGIFRTIIANTKTK